MPIASLAASEGFGSEKPESHSAGDELIIVDAVRRAWEASFPSIPFDLEKTWGDLGTDPLKALEFVLRLERALEVRVSFDAMAPECTATELVQLLARGAAPQGSVSPRSRVFLVPGIGGDEPRLAQFRRALHRDVSFETLELPDIEYSVHVLGNIPATAGRLVEQVISLQPDGDILLAGYSYGCLVAQEMARQLEARGRTVAFLALLDGQLSPVKQGDDTTAGQEGVPSSFMSLTIAQATAIKRALWNSKSRFKSALATRENWRSFFDGIIFYVLSRMHALELARRFLAGASQRHEWMWTKDRRRWLITRIRSWAVLRWRPSVSNVPTLLVLSDDPHSIASVQGWRAACSQLRIIPVHCEHKQIFERGSMAMIVPAFLKGLPAAQLNTPRTA